MLKSGQDQKFESDFEKNVVQKLINKKKKE